MGCAAKVAYLVENIIFSRVDRPTQKQPLTCKWEIKQKKRISVKWNSTWPYIVARDFTQDESIDYT